MKEVREKLFIGNIVDAGQVKFAKDPPVTHILSLVAESGSFLESQKPSELPPAAEKLVRMVVHLLDVAYQNILDELEPCLEFIEQGRSAGGVLVHCLAGISRSGAVVTAYLMKKENLSAAAALRSVQSASPAVSPNSGFLSQLTIFQKMGCKVDHNSPFYKKYKVEVFGKVWLKRVPRVQLFADESGNSFANGGLVESSSYAVDPGSVVVNISAAPSHSQEGERKGPALYRCKKCRRVIARDDNVIGHDVGGGEASFKWNKRGGGRSGKEESERPACTSVFVEPMQWMTTVEGGVVEGKLQCVKCEARLGNFNWSGMQCSCGAWVTPAFQLHKSRMDAAPF